MSLPKFKVLIIDSSQDIQKKLSEILRIENIDVQTAQNANEGFQMALGFNFDLIIFRHESKDISGFQMYQKLENHLIYSGTAFFLLCSNCVNEDLIIGLEMGIDGFIFIPLNTKTILRKINKHFTRVRKNGFFDEQRFNEFFARSPVPKFIAENLKIIKYNESFKNLLDLNEDQFTNHTIQDLFLLTVNKKHKLTFRKIENGLIDYCCLKRINVQNDLNNYFDLHLYGIAKNKNSKIFAELIPVGIESNFKTLRNLYPQKHRKQEWVKSQHSRAPGLSIQLTKREQEIYAESAKGYPIKQIASILNLSERTVEKHRSNIMSKTDSHSILEAILVIENQSYVDSKSVE